MITADQLQQLPHSVTIPLLSAIGVPILIGAVRIVKGFVPHPPPMPTTSEQQQAQRRYYAIVSLLTVPLAALIVVSILLLTNVPMTWHSAPGLIIGGTITLTYLAKGAHNVVSRNNGGPTPDGGTGDTWAIHATGLDPGQTDSRSDMVNVPGYGGRLSDFAHQVIDTVTGAATADRTQSPPPAPQGDLGPVAHLHGATGRGDPPPGSEESPTPFTVPSPPLSDPQANGLVARVF